MTKTEQIEACCKEILKENKTLNDTRYRIKKKGLTTSEIIEKYGLDKEFIYKLLNLK